MRSKHKGLAVLLLITAASFATYHYAMADLPRRDQFMYMIERAYMQNDWQWLWHSLSWSRTRFLFAGDNYLFRPIHMAVLALKDILFRQDLFYSGVVNICIMAVASFSLYNLTRRLVAPALALALALLFMVQHAGVEIVAWGHINPYLLSLAFFGFALAEMLKGTEQSLTRAGVLLFAGALVHEMVIVAMVFTGVAALYVWLRTRGRAMVGDVPISRYILKAMLLPGLAYAVLDLLDYLYRGGQSLIGPSDKVAEHGARALIDALTMFPGAAGIALMLPFKVVLRENKALLAWKFDDSMALAIGVGIAFYIVVGIAIFFCVRALRKGRGSSLTLVTLMALLMTLGLMLGVGIGRVYLRSDLYIFNATYYYSLAAYFYCMLAAFALRYLFKKLEGRPKARTISGAAAFAVMAVLIAVNFTMVQKTLAQVRPDREGPINMELRIDDALNAVEGEYCFAGFGSMKGDIDPWAMQSLLLRERFCLDGDKRTPVYLTMGPGGALWLTEIRRPAMLGPSVEPVEMETKGPRFKLSGGAFISGEKLEDAWLLVSRKTYVRPDLAVNVRTDSIEGIVLGYKDPGDFLVFMIEWPIVYGRVMEGGKFSPSILKNVLPSYKPEYRIEVRHVGPNAYLFVDNFLLTAMPDTSAGGRVGILLRDKGTSEKPEYSDFVASETPMGAMGNMPVKRITR